MGAGAGTGARHRRPWVWGAALIQLLAILTPIALLDSASIVPICIVVLVVLLAGPKPVLRSFSHILGVFLTYFAGGLLVLLGLQEVFEEISAYAIRLWQSPETIELIAQILIGIVLCGVGFKMASGRDKRSQKPVASDMTSVQAFLAGAGMTIVGMPGAIPYLAAIDLILREDLDLVPRILALGYYNLVFVAPLAAIVGLRMVAGDRGHGVLDAVRRFFDRWSQRVIIFLLIGLGVILIADGIGWFLGYPIIPV